MIKFFLNLYALNRIYWIQKVNGIGREHVVRSNFTNSRAINVESSRNYINVIFQITSIYIECILSLTFLHTLIIGDQTNHVRYFSLVSPKTFVLSTPQTNCFLASLAYSVIYFSLYFFSILCITKPFPINGQFFIPCQFCFIFLRVTFLKFILLIKFKQCFFLYNHFYVTFNKCVSITLLFVNLIIIYARLLFGNSSLSKISHLLSQSNYFILNIWL